MSDYLTTDTELTSVANAIRTKGGTSASLVYPTGFVSAIQAISTGTDVSDTTAAAADVRTGKYFYTANGTKTQGTIADQAAQTITPTTTDQTIASGKYLTGAQTIKGDANLIAGNIKKDVQIFGVTGNYEGGGGGGGAEDGIITRTISGTYENSRVTKIGDRAFAYCVSLINVSFPACTSIGAYAFNSCTSLATVNASKCTSIGTYAFYYCTHLSTISFPACTTIDGYAFGSCVSLTTASFQACKSIGSSAFSCCSVLSNVSFPACTSIGSGAFYSCRQIQTASFPACSNIWNSAFGRCYGLISLYLTGSYVASLRNSNAFTSTPIAGYTTSTGGVYGSIYVPSSLLTSYKTATNWTYFSSRFVGV